VGDDDPGWIVEHLTGTAASFHGRELPAGGARRVWVHAVTGPALVLGSTQSPDLVDPEAAARAGVEVVRRRSGGGAVLVEPGGVVWVDVVVPPHDGRWDDDVGRATHWVGDAWARALAACGIAGATVHRGGMAPTPWSRLVCFGGMGPGEVAVGGRKVVGIAQRRTRDGARFQTAVLLRWEPERLLALLRLPADDAARAADDLAARAAPVAASASALVTALLDALDHESGG